LLGKSRQALYDSLHRKEERQMEEVVVLGLVKEIRKNHKYMGTEKLLLKLRPDLKLHNIKIGRDALYQLLGEHGMLVRQSKFKPRTTNSNHAYYRYNNIAEKINVVNACQLWVSDITYIRTEKGFVYLSLITDCYSHKIVGWGLRADLTSKGVLSALDMALLANTKIKGLTHHSDRGIQYCSKDYVKALEDNNIAISMTQNGDPYENALAERVNGILKYEYDLKDTFKDLFEAIEKVKQSIDLYNNERPHMSCDMLTPNEAHKRTGELKKHWKSKNYKSKEIKLQ